MATKTSASQQVIGQLKDCFRAIFFRCLTKSGEIVFRTETLSENIGTGGKSKMAGAGYLVDYFSMARAA